MSVYICILTAKSSRAKKDIHERFATCYSDERVLVFDTLERPTVVAAAVTAICDREEVGCIVVPMEPGRFFVHGVSMPECFGDARLAFADDVDALREAARRGDFMMKR